MLWSDAQGAILGYEDGRFGVTDPITREQMITMLWRLAGKPAGVGDLSRFADAAEISDWAAEAMAWAVGAGILRGDENGNLNPTGSARRSEVAQFIKNYEK